MSFEQQLELTETQWHDARLCRLSYSLSDDAAEAVLELQLYATPHVRDRHVRMWRFVDVHDLVLSANGPELQSHHGAGHVIQARLHESDRVDLNVYLCGAYLRVSADGLRDAPEAHRLGDAGKTSREESAAPFPAGPRKAMTAADAEAILEFSKTDDWFDGRLRRLTLITSRETTDVVMDLELPNPLRAADREPRAYRFRSVEDVTIALNSAELRRRRVRQGHITQGRMNYGRMDAEFVDQAVDLNQLVPLDLSVYTTGGYVRIAAKAVEPCGVR